MRGSDYYLTTEGAMVLDNLSGIDEVVFMKIILDDSTSFSTREQALADGLERVRLIGKIKDLPVRG